MPATVFVAVYGVGVGSTRSPLINATSRQAPCGNERGQRRHFMKPEAFLHIENRSGMECNECRPIPNSTLLEDALFSATERQKQDRNTNKLPTYKHSRTETHLCPWKTSTESNNALNITRPNKALVSTQPQSSITVVCINCCVHITLPWMQMYIGYYKYI